MPSHFDLTFQDSYKIRIIIIDDQPWFVASDVCDTLSIVNTARALSRLDEDEKDIHSMNTPGGEQKLSTINESGLYSLILTSRKAEARKFKKWVTRACHQISQTAAAARWIAPRKLIAVLS